MISFFCMATPFDAATVSGLVSVHISWLSRPWWSLWSLPLAWPMVLASVRQSAVCGWKVMHESASMHLALKSVANLQHTAAVHADCGRAWIICNHKESCGMAAIAPSICWQWRKVMWFGDCCDSCRIWRHNMWHCWQYWHFYSATIWWSALRWRVRQEEGHIKDTVTTELCWSVGGQRSGGFWHHSSVSPTDSSSREVDQHTNVVPYFQYELTATPISLFNGNCMNKPVKPALANVIAGHSGLVVTCLTAVWEDRGSNPTVSSCVFIVNITMICSLGHGLLTLTAVPGLTQPSTLRGMVKWVSAFGLSNNL